MLPGEILGHRIDLVTAGVGGSTGVGEDGEVQSQRTLLLLQEDLQVGRLLLDPGVLGGEELDPPGVCGQELCCQ